MVRNYMYTRVARFGFELSSIRLMTYYYCASIQRLQHNYLQVGTDSSLIFGLESITLFGPTSWRLKYWRPTLQNLGIHGQHHIRHLLISLQYRINVDWATDYCTLTNLKRHLNWIVTNQRYNSLSDSLIRTEHKYVIKTWKFLPSA